MTIMGCASPLVSHSTCLAVGLRLPIVWSEAAWRSARAALRSRSRSRTFKSAASAAAVSVSIAAKSGYGCAMREGVFFWLSTILRQNAMRSLIGSLFQLRRILAIRVRGVVGDASSRWMPVPKKIGGLGIGVPWRSLGFCVLLLHLGKMGEAQARTLIQRAASGNIAPAIWYSPERRGSPLAILDIIAPVSLAPIPRFVEKMPLPVGKVPSLLEK